MTNDRITEASNILRQAQVAIDDCNRISHAQVQRAAIDAVKPLVDQLVEAALAELSQA